MMSQSEKEIRFIHIYGTPWAPNWNRHEMITLLADTGHAVNVDSDQISPLGRPDDPPRKISYFCALRDSDDERMIITCMNDTANLPIDKITFGSRNVNIQLLMFTWFDYFQYETVQQEAQNVAKQAVESDIPLGLIVDVTTPKRYQVVEGAYIRDGKYMGNLSRYVNIPEDFNHFRQPVPEDVPIFMEMLGLNCPWVMVDHDKSREEIRREVDDLIDRCSRQ